MARTSSYSKFLQPVEAPAVNMPGWVLGGDYGDISKRILQEEVTRAQLEAQQLAQETNEQRLEDAQRQNAYRDALSSRLTPEMSMRDAYETAAKTALENGQPEDYMQIRNTQLREEQQKRNDRIQALTTAPRLAQSGLGQEALALLADQGITAPDNFIEANLKRERGLGGSVRVYNPETGEYEMLIAPQAKARGEGKEKKREELFKPDGSAITVRDTAEYNAAWDAGYRPKEQKSGSFLDMLNEGISRTTERQKGRIDEVKAKFDVTKAPPNLTPEQFREWKKGQK